MVIKFSCMVKTRFAPSPTGSLHIGGLRTALFSYALARHYKGKFVLRIEDTDKKREVKGSKEEVIKHLKDFNLTWDEYYVQSERKDAGIYKKAAEKLIGEGRAFYCRCEPRNAKKEGYSKILKDPCRDKNFKDGAVKLKVPENKKVSYRDFVLGKEVHWNTSDITEATLLKSDGYPTYHLAVVVDDSDMGITHALRGYDWMPSTPIHLLVYRYLKLELPEIGHLTDILDPGGGKLSKRRGSVSINDFIKEGYLHEALLNFVMLLGWAPKDNREFFTLKEFIGLFDEKGFQKSNPIFNRDKLDWMNANYIGKLTDEEFAGKVKAFAPEKAGINELKKISPLIKTRIKKFSEFGRLANALFITPPLPRGDLLKGVNKKHLKATFESLREIDEKQWEEKIDKVLIQTVDKNQFKTGDFFMSLRIAIFSSNKTPPLNDSMKFIGKSESLTRIRRLI